jgi:succinate dehydrogenase (ubiquinone) membrane anchor subunit
MDILGRNRTSSAALDNNNLVLIPKRSSSGGDHVKLWTAEKIVSASFLPIIPLAFIFPSCTMDYLLAFTIAIHSHWGIEAIVVDYVRPSVFGDFIPKLAQGLVWGLSALTLGGLFYFIYSDVGIVCAIKMLWKL